MAWKEPKTDWVKTDAVSYDHYNRIIGNIKYISDLAKELYVDFPLEDMGNEETAAHLYKADEWNRIEDNLEMINRSTYTLEIGMKKTFFPNAAFVDFEELNRIEKACLEMHKILLAQKAGRKRLSLVLGGGIIKV